MEWMEWMEWMELNELNEKNKWNKWMRCLPGWLCSQSSTTTCTESMGQLFYLEHTWKISAAAFRTYKVIQLKLQEMFLYNKTYTDYFKGNHNYCISPSKSPLSQSVACKYGQLIMSLTSGLVLDFYAQEIADHLS